MTLEIILIVAVWLPDFTVIVSLLFTVYGTLAIPLTLYATLFNKVPLIVLNLTVIGTFTDKS